jgi:tRNA-specific 2-thiouridylase
MKCIVLFSGGLDSRLTIKIMQERGFEVLAIYFKLPIGCSNEKEVKEFVKKHKIKLKIFDCSKGKLFKEYLETIKKAKHGRGKGVKEKIRNTFKKKTNEK